MSPRLPSADAAPPASQDAARPTLAITLPTEIHQHHHEPAPALVTKRNAAHVGMSGPELLRVLRDMRADPRFRDRVIVRGKSLRAAAPCDVIAYLRSAPTREQEDDGLDHELLASVDYEPKVRAGGGRRAPNS